MKNLFFLPILIIMLLYQSCGQKEKQEKTETLNDSIVSETVITDTVSTIELEVIAKDLSMENEKAPIEKTTTITKITTKEPNKVIPQKTVAKVTEDIKAEVETKVEIAKEPKKVEEAETPIEVDDQMPKVTYNISDWKIPVKYQTMKNPTNPSIDLAIGKSLYTKHCKSCHGSEGYGDGTKAKEMKGNLGDFSTKEFQEQNDGALFYKTSFGRDDMPAFNKKISSDEDRWLVINYVRTLKQ